MIRYKGYEHTHTNPEKSETTARRQAKNADRTLIFAKEKPKPNTFVFDLGFDWRRKRESSRFTPLVGQADRELSPAARYIAILFLLFYSIS